MKVRILGLELPKEYLLCSADAVFVKMQEKLGGKDIYERER